MRLGDVAPGTVKKIGGLPFIILGQSITGTALIAEKIAASMSFGSTGDYEASSIRRYCVGDFYDAFADRIGADRILPHCVRLQAYDGTGADKTCYDPVSVLTLDRYRYYRQYLPALGDWWWLATRVSFDDRFGYARCACYVNSNGVPNWYVCDNRYGVRPFLILNPDILVS